MQNGSSVAAMDSAEVLLTRAARHDAIRNVLSTRQITSQEELRKALAAQGFETVQATLSRDLSELRAVKVRGSQGQSTYQIVDDDGRSPSAVEPSAARLARWCQELLVGADCAQNILVLRTPAGAANMLGAAIDSARLKYVVGTLAGDDTIFTVCRDESSALALRQELLELAGRTS
ncbi:arginine repressor [Actinomycetaceae bacterium MB13-C1-2]|nr:arginine repressor [Actinomycetaceae bacterium MB13-C1-2]